MKATTDLISPLRYPGSKYILADYFERTIHENLFTGCYFYEPYAGGASMSLCLLGREAISRATLVERVLRRATGRAFDDYGTRGPHLLHLATE